MIDKQTYWTAIPRDGKWHDVETAQCLAMETKTCVPCSSIVPTTITFATTMSPCWAYFAIAQPRSFIVANMTNTGSSDFAVLNIQEESLGTGMLAVDIDPPRRVLAMKCGN